MAGTVAPARITGPTPYAGAVAPDAPMLELASDEIAYAAGMAATARLVPPSLAGFLR